MNGAEWMCLGPLIVFVVIAGVFGMAVEIFGPEWVDELWDRWH